MTAKAVIVCTWNDSRGGLPGMIGEVLTLSRKIGALFGSEVGWLHLGSMSDEVPELGASYGVTSIDWMEDPKLVGSDADPMVTAAAQYFGRTAPKVLLCGQTFDARVFAPRLAGRVGACVVMNATDVETGEGGALMVTASAYGGDTRVVYELSGAPACVIGVSANSVEPTPLGQPSSRPEVRRVAVDLTGVEERIRVVERAVAKGPRLEDARIIVAGGRGLRDPENYRLVEELADALGGMAAASRPIVDEKWTDPSRQIGLTGKITRPTLYLAAGISGASQHMVGCSAAKTIVAINTDAEAAIFQHARYGVVANCLEVLPELIRAAKDRGVARKAAQ